MHAEPLFLLTRLPRLGGARKCGARILPNDTKAFMGSSLPSAVAVTAWLRHE